MKIDPITEKTRPLTTDYIAKEWFGTDMLIRGAVIDMTKVDGFVLLDESGTNIIGLVTYIIRDGICEITSLNSERENQGIGTALIEKVYNVPVDLDRNLQKEREPDTVKQAKERQ
ncbi:MAG: hypothetical protein FWC62_07535 [Firmicutes bacterium]|nr:hypothetical protein [Bacillota bacterium]